LPFYKSSHDVGLVKGKTGQAGVKGEGVFSTFWEFMDYLIFWILGIWIYFEP
jgi:hypothetical protein